jgi:hypothetical protein
MSEERFNEVRKKAAELKSGIEKLLKQFRDETGYTPEVKVETRVKPTNDKTFVSQNVSITVTVQ